MYRRLNDLGLWELASSSIRYEFDSAMKLQDWLGNESRADQELTRVMQELLKEAFDKWLKEPDRIENLVLQYTALEPLDRAFSRLYSSFLREHLVHVVRDLLLALIMRQGLSQPTSVDTRSLIVAALLHDIAYPIERLTRNLEEYTSRISDYYLAGEFNLKLAIKKPDTLLALLHNLGDSTHAALSPYYQNVAFPTLAEVGLFDSIHSLSGSVLFLGLFQDEVRNEVLTPEKLDSLVQVATAIALHDRSVMPWTTVDPLSAVLRLADELQEWGRGSGPVTFKTPSLDSQPSGGRVLVSIDVEAAQGDSSVSRRPSAVYLLADKILGLWPLGAHFNAIQLTIGIRFPDHERGNVDCGKESADELKRRLIDRIVEARQEAGHRTLQRTFFNREGLVVGDRRRSGPDTWRHDNKELEEMLHNEICVEGSWIRSGFSEIVLHVSGVRSKSPRVQITL